MNMILLIFHRNSSGIYSNMFVYMWMQDYVRWNLTFKSKELASIKLKERLFYDKFL